MAGNQTITVRTRDIVFASILYVTIGVAGGAGVYAWNISDDVSKNYEIASELQSESALHNDQIDRLEEIDINQNRQIALLSQNISERNTDSDVSTPHTIISDVESFFPVNFDKWIENINPKDDIDKDEVDCFPGFGEASVIEEDILNYVIERSTLSKQIKQVEISMQIQLDRNYILMIPTFNNNKLESFMPIVLRASEVDQSRDISNKHKKFEDWKELFERLCISP